MRPGLAHSGTPNQPGGSQPNQSVRVAFQKAFRRPCFGSPARIQAQRTAEATAGTMEGDVKRRPVPGHAADAHVQEHGDGEACHHPERNAEGGQVGGISEGLADEFPIICDESCAKFAAPT